MKIKDIIKKENNGVAKKIAIGGTILSPLAIPTLKVIETQVLLHSASTVAFGGVAKVGTGITLSGVLAPLGIGLVALGGVGLLATVLVKSGEKEIQKC